MPIHRSHAADLARMLNRAKQPIYVLDDERTIVFFNAACADWLGRAAEDLAGRRAAYRSSVGAGPDAAAAGLCPPPQAFSGEIVSATVAAVRQDGRTVERRARFFPLAFGEENIAGVLAVLDVADLSPDSALPANAGAVEPSPIDLHELVRRF